jgi:hypothetical protein
MLPLLALISTAAGDPSSPPMVPATPPEGARVERHANGTVCVFETNADGEDIESCRSASGDYERPHKPASDVIRQPLPAAPRASSRQDLPEEKRVDTGIHPDPGSRAGFAGVAAGAVNIRDRATSDGRIGGSAIFGVGFRYGLLERETRRVWMPGLSILIGAVVGPDEVAPYAEARGELMHVGAGGPLQPNFNVYVSSGLRYDTTGLRLLRPYAGLGIGWNWLPEKSPSWGGLGSGLGGGGGGEAALVLIAIAAAALAITAFVLAGRLEVRYTVSTDPLHAPGFASVVIGFGA